MYLVRMLSLVVSSDRIGITHNTKNLDHYLYNNRDYYTNTHNKLHYMLQMKKNAQLVYLYIYHNDTNYKY